jgi:hypothetical protein
MLLEILLSYHAKHVADYRIFMYIMFINNVNFITPGEGVPALGRDHFVV